MTDSIYGYMNDIASLASKIKRAQEERELLPPDDKPYEPYTDEEQRAINEQYGELKRNKIYTEQELEEYLDNRDRARACQDN